MRPDLARADRMQALRETARDWFRAGWIDENGRRAIEQSYPDDRVRTGFAFRVLFFVLTLCALLAATGIVYVQVRSHYAAAAFALTAGLISAAATGCLIGPLKRRQGGIEAALSLGAILNLMVGIGIFLYEIDFLQYQDTSTLLLFLLALLSAAAAWFWGYWPYAALSAYSLFHASITLPAGRLLWIVGLLALYRPLTAGCNSPRLPPSLRKSAAANVFTLDHGVAGYVLDSWRWNAEFFPRWLSIALTAVVPLAVFFLGVVARRRLFLNLGIVLAIFSVLTLRQYYHLAPPWLLLSAAGALLLAAAAGLRRFLNSGAAGERMGFSAEPLGQDPGRRRPMEILASVATLTPGSPPATERPQFRGRGGEFGGGGASGDF